jgi:poly [ADP-ribose] polymerase
MITKDNGLRFAKLIHVSVDNGKTDNSNKVYIMEELSDGRIKCDYGRVGKSLVTEYKPKAKWDSVYRQKLSKTEVKKKRLYWHGSRNENWFNILQTGLLIRPSGAVYSGSMFGDGIYFADKAQKSIGYTSLRGSYWAHGGDSKAFLALFDVHVGKQKEILHHDSSCYSLSDKVMKKEGYDSVFAKGGADLRNNEYIIYNGAQCTVSHLIEIGD